MLFPKHPCLSHPSDIPKVRLHPSGMRPISQKSTLQRLVPARSPRIFDIWANPPRQDGGKGLGAVTQLEFPAGIAAHTQSHPIPLEFQGKTAKYWEHCEHTQFPSVHGKRENEIPEPSASSTAKSPRLRQCPDRNFIREKKEGKLSFPAAFCQKFPGQLQSDRSRISREVGKSPGHRAEQPLIAFPCCFRKRIGNSPGIHSEVGSWSSLGVTSLLSQAGKHSLQRVFSFESQGLRDWPQAAAAALRIKGKIRASNICVNIRNIFLA